MEFKANEIESKWRNFWKSNQTYKVKNEFDKPKYYVLDMFPYPSGAGLHVGHPLGYIASDIYARHKRMNGYNVLHPMGFDAFGLPAEQYALQMGVHPEVSTKKNIERYKEQLDLIGLNFDWNREIQTCDDSYYKWTQWIFSKLFTHGYDSQLNKPIPIQDIIATFEKNGHSQHHYANNQEEFFTAQEWNTMNAKEQDEILMNFRLAYRKISFVNWCEALGTVLANDEIKDGVSERGGHPVEKKPMMQWCLRISAYAERLLNDLDALSWSDALKTMQRNWIGKSIGAKVIFEIHESNHSIEIYTTRPDTIFGSTFMVLAPEHKLIPSIVKTEYKNDVELYLDAVKNKSSRERQADTKTVSGVFTGSFALHPFSGQKIPIWISDYVLIEYGTGAIMAVPAHDQRDKLFAKKFDLPIIQVVDQSSFSNANIEDKIGKMIDSDFMNGLDVKDAILLCIQKIKEKNIGEERVNYKMRDANFSRQRYWGEPFPIYYDKTGVSHLIKDLPVRLPRIEKIEQGKNGQSPLSNAIDWVNEIPDSIRETDTMPGYAGSSWYFLRYMDPNNPDEFASKEALNYWLDVDLYIGGTEHAVGHLMYSRFWHKFLFDLGFVQTNEPFKKLVNQGMIQGVIESILLKKNSNPPLFIDAAQINKLDDDLYSKIPVHISFVQNYNAANTHLDKNGIQQFVNWIPEYNNAIFEFNNMQYNAYALPDDIMVRTVSEVGKMSKRYHNVVNPDDVVGEYGADCFRMYEMFLGPLEQSKPWDTKGISGVSGFLNRFYSLFWTKEDTFHISDDSPTKDELKILHTCIKKVNEDIENLSFNTAVSAFMICVNELKKINCTKAKILLPLTKLLAPFAPFITEEIWSLSKQEGSVHHASYPKHDDSYLISAFSNYPVSINGKKRYEWQVAKGKDKTELETEVLQLDEIQKWLEGAEIKKIIIVPERMINIVI